MKTLWKTVPKKNWERVRIMRRQPSPPEHQLGQALKAHAAGLHFRRQHPIGTCIVDFCAVRQRLVVEVDGSMHDEESAREHDVVRDEFLNGRGFRVLHVSARDVMQDTDGVVAKIMENLNPPAPKA